MGRALRVQLNLRALNVNLHGDDTRQRVASERITNSIIDAHDLSGVR